MSWMFLSYLASEELSGYGGGDRIKIRTTRSMCCGDTSNNTEFSMPTHFGTHMDFPFHFSADGKTGDHYPAEFFIFNKIAIQCLDLRMRNNKLIGAEDVLEDYAPDTELLIVKTFYSELRAEEEYWRNGPGFLPEVARLYKQKMPGLRAIAFDSISLTNFQNREIGRASHKSFLIENDILLIEDVDLSRIDRTTKLKQVVVSPLRMKNADGAPVTIMAELQK